MNEIKNIKNDNGIVEYFYRGVLDGCVNWGFVKYDFVNEKLLNYTLDDADKEDEDLMYYLLHSINYVRKLYEDNDIEESKIYEQVWC